MFNERVRGIIKNKTIVFTGTLMNFSREQAHALVHSLRGYPKQSLTNETDLLVVGSIVINLFKGHSDTIKIKKAKQLIKDGSTLKIISEKEFLQMVYEQVTAYKKFCL